MKSVLRRCQLRFYSSITEPTWLHILHLVLLLLAIGSIVQFLILACLRLFYPFELEWMEGASVDQALWVLRGNSLYPAPTMSFIPGFYNPVYYYVAAALMKVIGVGFVAPRLISIVSTLGCALLIYAIVAQEPGQKPAGLLAAGVYVATFRFTGAWMDIARTDSLFLFVLLAAFFVGERYPDRKGKIASGLLYVASYYVKQTALLVVLVMAPLSLLTSRGRTWLRWLTTALVGVLIFFALDLISHGWFSFYTFDMATYRDRVADIWFFWRSLAGKMWPALLISVAYLVAVLFEGPVFLFSRETERRWRHVVFGSALLASGWSAFLQRWAYDNNFMPACAGLAILAGVGYSYLNRQVNRWGQEPRAAFFRAGLLGLFLIQFAFLVYNPIAQLPTEQARLTWEQFIARLHDLPGETLVFYHGFANYLAGKDSYLHSTSYSDAAGGGASPPRTEDNRWRRDAVKQVFQQALSKQMFDWILAREPAENWLPYYVPAQEAPVQFSPLTGAPGSPEILFQKNPVARGGTLPLVDASLDYLWGEGWSIPESWGRWSVGHKSALQLAFETEYDYKLVVDAFPFCPPSFGGQTMHVALNGVSVGDYSFATCEQQSISFELPAQELTGGLNILEFGFSNALSPAQVGLSDDSRTLAVGFASLRFVQEKPAAKK